MSAGFAGERLFVDGADAGVGTIADVNHAIANRYAARTLRALAPALFHLFSSKTGNLANAVIAGIHHVDRTDVNGGNPDVSRFGIVRNVIHGNGSPPVIGKRQSASGV